MDKYPSIRRSSCNSVILFMTNGNTGIVLDSANSKNLNDTVGTYINYWSKGCFREIVPPSEMVNITSKDFNIISDRLDFEPDKFSDEDIYEDERDESTW